MIDINKKYRTRDGHEVRIYATDGGEPSPVHGAIKTGGGWDCHAWMREGSWMHFKGPNDLVEVKPRIKRAVWIDLYPDNGTWLSSENKAVGLNCLARVKVEIDCEEGEGL
jgi:hypothetical protein